MCKYSLATLNLALIVMWSASERHVSGTGFENADQLNCILFRKLFVVKIDVETFFWKQTSKSGCKIHLPSTHYKWVNRVVMNQCKYVVNFIHVVLMQYIINNKIILKCKIL